MKRPIKFRCWSEEEQRMYPAFSLYEYMCLNECAQEDLSPHDRVLLQFTGLLDRTGKEIYEGDIVTDNLVNSDMTPRYYPIVFYKGMFMIDLGDCKSPIKSYVEVIGNIYENKDLLNGN